MLPHPNELIKIETKKSLVNSNLNAEEFNISAKEIVVDKENETLVGKGSVEATDLEGNIIYSDNITYKKSKELVLG